MGQLCAELTERCYGLTPMVPLLAAHSIPVKAAKLPDYFRMVCLVPCEKFGQVGMCFSCSILASLCNLFFKQYTVRN